jgi:hypothetical protein
VAVAAVALMVEVAVVFEVALCQIAKVAVVV